MFADNFVVRCQSQLVMRVEVVLTKGDGEVHASKWDYERVQQGERESDEEDEEVIRKPICNIMKSD